MIFGLKFLAVKNEFLAAIFFFLAAKNEILAAKIPKHFVPQKLALIKVRILKAPHTPWRMLEHRSSHL